MLEPVIRKAELKDVKQIEDLMRSFWKVDVDYAKELKNDEAVLLVAEIPQTSDDHDSRISGAVLMWVTRWNSTGYLVEIAVRKEWQRKGIAKALLERLSVISVDFGFRTIIVETQTGNKDAIDFYLANGLRFCGSNDRYYTNHPKTAKDIAIFFSLDL